MEPTRRILSLPRSLSSLILLISATVPLAIAGPALTDDSQCGCYRINDDSSTYFTHHRFFDFRSLPQYAGVPAVIQDVEASADADPTSDYFKDSEWSSFWYLGSWNNSNGAREDATVTMVNSPNNVYIEANTEDNPSSQTYLTLRTQRLKEFQTAAEIESSSSKFKYLSLRMRARTVGAGGAITALFTYRGGETLADVQEADLEIRTDDPRNVLHYTNQPAYTDDGVVIPEATRNATMPNGLDWTAWAVHRLDWTPGLTTWYVNDVIVAQIEFQAPHDESNIILNAWSDGGRWTGNMTLYDAAYLQVQWLEVLYNSTEAVATEQSSSSSLSSGSEEDKKKKKKRRKKMNKRCKKRGDDNSGGGGGCNAVCSIDETSEVGTPVMLWNNSPPQTNGNSRRVEMGSVPTGVVSAMALFSIALLV